MKRETSQLLNALRSVCGEAEQKKPVMLHEPTLNDSTTREYVNDCLESGWVSSAGEWVKRFEKRICLITNSPNAVAVTNGTVGLRLGLHVLGVRRDDEVITSPLSFVATANAISHLGAIPHFVDIEKTSLSICPEALEKRLEEIAIRVDNHTVNKKTNRKITAIMPVHIFGRVGNIERIVEIANKWNIRVLEDAAEALGSWKKEKHCGLIGDAGVISFNGNKIVTTGGGGVLISKDESLIERARYISTTAKKAHPWEYEHTEIGWNDRMPNINAALGCAQLDKLNEILAKKRRLHEKYMNEINNFENIELLTDDLEVKSNHWLNAIRLREDNDEDAEKIRSEILEVCNANGYMLRPCWKPMHSFDMYKQCPKGVIKETEKQYKRVINLPSSPHLTKTNV